MLWDMSCVFVCVCVSVSECVCVSVRVFIVVKLVNVSVLVCVYCVKCGNACVRVCVCVSHDPSNAGVDTHASNAEFNTLMGRAAHTMNLKRHIAGTTPGKALLLHAPCDIEGPPCFLCVSVSVCVVVCLFVSVCVCVCVPDHRAQATRARTADST